MYNQHPIHRINYPGSIWCFRRLFVSGMSTYFIYSTVNKIKNSFKLSSSIPPHENNFWNMHSFCVIVLVASGKWFLLDTNFNHLPAVVPHMECSREQGYFNHQQRFLGAKDQPCHRKWGSNFFPKPNVVNPEIQHHEPFVLPLKVPGKLKELHIPLRITPLQRSLPLLPTF